MTHARPQRCLLIAPLTFYSFHRTISAALEKRGYQVDTLNEEFPDNVFGKIMGKLALPVLRRTTLAGLKARLDKRPHYDLLLIIKGRGLGPDVLRYLRTRAQRIVAYNFDSFRYNPSPRDWHHLTDRYATFDIDDARRTGLPLVHLFCAVPSSPDGAERIFDISIIMRVHSDRLRQTRRLLEALPDGWKPFVFLFESSRLTLLLGIIRSPHHYWRLRRYISLKPLPYSEAIMRLGQSRVTFDYAHPDQSGITVRCFEAQGLGTAILTNNLAAVDSGLFEEGGIAHLPASARAEEIQQLLIKLIAHPPRPAARTLDDFLDDLIGTEASQPTHPADGIRTKDTQ